jgi:DMSO/TMAO reductase YedYZ molybdopterin-dependent catalytic subunit
MQSGSGDRRKVEFQMSEEGRLPPGQSLTLKFPVLHYGPGPTFNLTEWDFRIWGEIENEGTWTWDEFQKLPKTKLKMDIHCVTRWSKFDAEWEGVSLHTLIDEGWLNLKPSALYVVQHCEYGFTANLPVTIALADNFLLATHYAGEPITPDHGFPLRGVVGAIPGRGELKDVYLWKGGKWLRGLEFLSEDKKGFWEQAGYHNEADIWKEERFD